MLHEPETIEIDGAEISAIRDALNFVLNDWDGRGFCDQCSTDSLECLSDILSRCKKAINEPMLICDECGQNFPEPSEPSRRLPTKCPDCENSLFG